MKLYRFSPIETEEQLFEAIRHLHYACNKLCYQIFGRYLPNAGNVGVFCHYDKEYDALIELRKKLTQEADNINQKYFRLHEPITIEANEMGPQNTYSYLYIRRPDPYRAQVGDVDFYIEADEYAELADNLPKGARQFERPELDMLELYDPNIDALAYVGTDSMVQKVRASS